MSQQEQTLTRKHDNSKLSAALSPSGSNSTPSSVPRLNLDVFKSQNHPDMSSESSNQQLTTGFSTKRSFTDQQQKKSAAMNFGNMTDPILVEKQKPIDSVES